MSCYVMLWVEKIISFWNPENRTESWFRAQWCSRWIPERIRSVSEQTEPRNSIEWHTIPYMSRVERVCFDWQDYQLNSQRNELIHVAQSSDKIIFSFSNHNRVLIYYSAAIYNLHILICMCLNNSIDECSV